MRALFFVASCWTLPKEFASVYPAFRLRAPSLSPPCTQPFASVYPTVCCTNALGGVWETQDIWNRTATDSGTAHQTPIVGVPNYGHVRVKNRGTKAATDVCSRSVMSLWRGPSRESNSFDSIVCYDS